MFFVVCGGTIDLVKTVLRWEFFRRSSICACYNFNLGLIKQAGKSVSGVGLSDFAIRLSFNIQWRAYAMRDPGEKRLSLKL